MTKQTKLDTKQPPKTLAVYLLEQEHGLPIEQVLVKLFEKHGSQMAMAKAIGRTQGTVSLWFKRYGVKLETVVVARLSPKPLPPPPRPPKHSRRLGGDSRGREVAVVGSAIE